MNEVKISIIVSTYNGAKTLPKAVESLLSQTLDSYEIILSDDCSADETRKIIEEYSKKYPDKVIANYMKSNTRASGSYNDAFKIAKGKYVAFIDQDDWADSKMYEKLYNLAEKENAEIADCDCAHVDSLGNIIEIEDSYALDQLGDITNEKRKLLFVWPGRQFTKIFRKDFLAKNNIYRFDNVCFGDQYFMELVAAYCNKIVKINEPLYYYRVDNESTVTRTYNNPILYDRVKCEEMMIKSLTERGFLDEYRDEIEFRFIELFYVNSIHVFLTQFKPCELNEIKYLQSKVKQNYGNYRKNKYYKARISKKDKILTFICDISPVLLCKSYTLYLKLKGMILRKQG